jgi:uncharacterized protein with HEPN domain
MRRYDCAVVLRQILEYAQYAQELCVNKAPPDLRADWRAAFALERVMEVVGEAVKRLPDELRQRYSQVPWRLIAGMRDMLVHNYDSVDYQILWDTVHNDMPLLIATVERMLSDLGNAPQA